MPINLINPQNQPNLLNSVHKAPLNHKQHHLHDQNHAENQPHAQNHVENQPQAQNHAENQPQAQNHVENQPHAQNHDENQLHAQNQINLEDELNPINQAPLNQKHKDNDPIKLLDQNNRNNLNADKLIGKDNQPSQKNNELHHNENQRNIRNQAEIQNQVEIQNQAEIQNQLPDKKSQSEVVQNQLPEKQNRENQNQLPEKQNEQENKNHKENQNQEEPQNQEENKKEKDVPIVIEEIILENQNNYIDVIIPSQLLQGDKLVSQTKALLSVGTGFNMGNFAGTLLSQQGCETVNLPNRQIMWPIDTYFYINNNPRNQCKIHLNHQIDHLPINTTVILPPGTLVSWCGRKVIISESESPENRTVKLT